MRVVQAPAQPVRKGIGAGNAQGAKEVPAAVCEPSRSTAQFPPEISFGGVTYHRVSPGQGLVSFASPNPTSRGVTASDRVGSARGGARALPFTADVRGRVKGGQVGASP